MGLVIPKGSVYIDLYDANDALTGERAFGSTPGLTVNITSESLEHYSAESGISEKDEESTTKITRKAALQADNVVADNLALFVVGDKSTVNQAATPVVDEAITVLKDRYYQLGVSSSNPTGVRNVSSVDVALTGGTPTYVLDTDYTLDAALGRIYIISGGSIADDADLVIDYTPAVETRERVASSSLASKTAAVRFIAANPRGDNRDWYFPKVTLKPNGDAVLKQTDPVWFTMGFDIEVLKKDASTEAVYIDGRAAA